MLAHQKRFPMMHNNFVKKKKRKKQKKKSAIRPHDVVIGSYVC
jgi:hypothetical protein